jgi:hypothetical protein
MPPNMDPDLEQAVRLSLEDEGITDEDQIREHLQKLNEDLEGDDSDSNSSNDSDNEDDVEIRNVFTSANHNYQALLDRFIRVRNMNEYGQINRHMQNNYFNNIFNGSLNANNAQNIPNNAQNIPNNGFESLFNMLLPGSYNSGIGSSIPTMHYTFNSGQNGSPQYTFSYSSNGPGAPDAPDVPGASGETNPFSLISAFLGAFGEGGALGPLGQQEDIPLVLKQSELDKIEKLNLTQLKEKVGEIDNDTQCCICLENVLLNDDTKEFATVKCGHYFHHSCIIEHLENYDYHCPICKEECGEHEPKI